VFRLANSIQEEPMKKEKEKAVKRGERKKENEKKKEKEHK